MDDRAPEDQNEAGPGDSAKSPGSDTESPSPQDLQLALQRALQGALEDARIDAQISATRDEQHLTLRFEFGIAQLLSPEQLERLNQTIPNFAERYMSMIEEQHSQELEMERLDAAGDASQRTRGLYVGAALVLLVALMAAWTAISIKSAWALVGTIGALATVVAVLVGANWYSARADADEIDEDEQ